MKNKLMTVGEVLELPVGDSEKAVWIDGFTALVVKIVATETKKRPVREMNICTLVDPNDDRGPELGMTIFGPVRFREGDVIEVSGKGLRRTEYDGIQQATPGRDTDIHVLEAAPAGRSRAEERQPARREPDRREERREPAPDTRGGSRDKGEHGRDERGDERRSDDPPEDKAADRAEAFHQKLSAYAILYLHCLAYGRKINSTLKAEGKPEMPPDQFQACVSTLFIAGDRNGLGVAPPPILRPAEAREPAPATRREDPAPSRAKDAPEKAGVDEDVPY